MAKLKSNFKFLSKMHDKINNPFEKRLSCSKRNYIRLLNVAKIYRQYHPEFKYRNMIHNELLGFVLDFYYDNEQEPNDVK